MPRLNSLGQATTGLGVTWYDASRRLALNTITLSDGTVLDPRAANAAYGCNGRWIAFCSGYGVFGSVLPATLPNAGLIPDPFESDYIADDGTFAYKTNYQSAGPWTLVNPDGSTRQFGTDPRAVQVLGANCVVWREANGLLVGLNSPVPLPTRTNHWHRIVSGHLLYQDDATGALVLDGKAIGSPGNYYRPDFLVRADGSMLVVWSPTEAETIVQSLLVTALTLAEATPVERVVFVDQPTPSPAPQPAPSPEPIPVNIPTPNHLDVVQAVAAQHPDLVQQMQAIAIPDNAPGGTWSVADQNAHAALCGQFMPFLLAALDAAEPGQWGYEDKESGANFPIPGTAKHGALKVAMYRPTLALVQILNDNGPVWEPLDMSDPNNQRSADFFVPVSSVPVNPNPPTPAPNPPNPAPSPAPVPAPAPAPSPDALAAILAAIAALQADVATLKASAAHHGDVVEVTGTPGLGDVLGGKAETWRGKID